jgi:hypothetical protein
MSKLGDKYIAGFLDADGCITMEWCEIKRNYESPIRVPHLVLKFAQLTEKDEVIYRIQEAIGGKISTRFMNGKCNCTCLNIHGKPAEMALSRIQKYLVVKRHIAGIALEMNKKAINMEEGKDYFKVHRKIRSYPLPNFPTRQWLAGYFDGDGCFATRLPKGRNAVQPMAEIACSDYDSEGIELIHKVFGGTIHPHGAEGHLRVWSMSMPPSKTKQFVGYFSKHLIVKKEQADFILGCADMGHYRDGISIKSAMKQLKAHPHRLNEPRPNASMFLKDVREMSGKELYKPRIACVV